MSTSNVPRFLAIAAKDRARRIGIPYTQALAEIQDELRNGQGGKHDHLGYGVGREVLALDPFGQDVDLDVALALIAAVRAGCPACQDRHYDTVASSSPLITTVVAPIIKVTPQLLLDHMSPATCALVPAVTRAFAENDVTPAYGALEELDPEARLDILEEALNTWAAGAAEPGQIQFHTIELDDDLGPVYAVVPRVIEISIGVETLTRPALVLIPESGPAGIEHLRSVGLPLMRSGEMPRMDPEWRLRVKGRNQSLLEIVHIDREGFDDHRLWKAGQPHRMPDRWWNLQDESSRVMIIGPGHPDSGEWTGEQVEADQIVAVIASVGYEY